MKRALLIGTGVVGGLGAVLTITPPQIGTHSSGGLGGGLGGGANSSAQAAGAQAPATQAPATQAPATAAAPAQNSPAATTPAPKTTKKRSTAKATTAAAKAKAAAEKAKAAKAKAAKAKATKAAGATTAAAPAPAQSTAAPAPAPTKAAPPPAATGVSGTFTGSAFDANERGRIWGSVQVTITLKNGVITSSRGSQNPSSRGQYAFNQIDPYVAGQQITIAGIKSKASSALPYVGGATYSSQAYWDSLKSALAKAGI